MDIKTGDLIAYTDMSDMFINKLRVGTVIKIIGTGDTSTQYYKVEWMDDYPNPEVLTNYLIRMYRTNYLYLLENNFDTST